MTVSKKLIENVTELKKALNEISVYDLDVYTAIELYYKIANKLNEVIKELSRFEGVVSDEVIKQNEKLLYLLGEGLTNEVIKKINQMIEDGTMDSIINHNVFNSLNTKVNNNTNNINNIFKNVEEEEGNTLKEKIDLCISKGYKKLILPTLETINDLIIDSNYIHYKFNRNLNVTGKGVTVKGNGNIIEFNSIYGDNVSIVNSELNPTPQKDYAISIKGAFNKISFDRIEGFNNGLLFEDCSNGTENNFDGLIQKCNIAVNLINTGDSAKHEGNTFNIRIFQCNKGYNISPHCKYQNINKVVDNAQISNSYDIIDNSGNHSLNLYFFRYGNSTFTNNVLLYNLNGMPFYQVGNKSSNTRVGVANIELTGNTTFIDFGNGEKDYDYRVINSTTETNEKCLSFRGSNGSTILNILESGYPAFPHRSEGAFGSDWSGYTPPNTTSPGAVVFAYNTTVGKARLYVWIASGWRYFEQTGTVV